MLDKEIAVSVIIPVYNKRPFLLRALRSVLQQTHQDIEVILVDDGSTDGSFDAIQDVHDARVRLVSQENQGVSAARNTGIDLARHPLVAFLDADDSWHPEFLAAMVALARRYPTSGIYASNYCIQYPDQAPQAAKIVGLPLFRKQFESNDYFRLGTGGDLPVSASSICIRRPVLNEVGGFPVGEAMGEDQHVWWRIAVRYSIAFDTRCLATYHCDADGRTCPVNLPDRELPFSRKLNEALPTLGLSLWQRWHATRYMGAHLLYLARENARAGRRDVAMRLLGDSRTRRLPLKWLWRRLQVAA